MAKSKDKTPKTQSDKVKIPYKKVNVPKTKPDYVEIPYTVKEVKAKPSKPIKVISQSDNAHDSASSKSVSYSQPYSLRMNSNTKAILEKIAEKEDRTLAYIINRILNDYVENNEP